MLAFPASVRIYHWGRLIAFACPQRDPWLNGAAISVEHRLFAISL